MVCVAGVLANKSSSVSSAMWSTVFSLAAESSEQDREIIVKHHIINVLGFFGNYIFYTISVNFCWLCRCFTKAKICHSKVNLTQLHTESINNYILMISVIFTVTHRGNHPVF